MDVFSGFQRILSSLDQIKTKTKSPEADVDFLKALLESPEFQSLGSVGRWTMECWLFRHGSIKIYSKTGTIFVNLSCCENVVLYITFHPFLSPAPHSVRKGDYWIRHRPSFRPSVHPNNLKHHFVCSYGHSCPCLLHEKHHYIIKAGDSRATRTLVFFLF